MIMATRVIPMEGFITTGGAGLPLDLPAARRITDGLVRLNRAPQTFNYHQITPQQEAEVAALVIRACRQTGTASHIAYAEPGHSGRPVSVGSKGRKVGRNDFCPCGSGRKYKVCCGHSMR